MNPEGRIARLARQANRWVQDQVRTNPSQVEKGDNIEVFKTEDFFQKTLLMSSTHEKKQIKKNIGKMVLVGFDSVFENSLFLYIGINLARIKTVCAQ